VTAKAGLKKAQIVRIAKECARLLDEKKARDICVMDLMRVNSYLDYFIIATGNSAIHCRALAREAQGYLRSIGLHERAKPSLESPWIVLDYSEIVIHIFTQEMRDYYQLEKLWADAERIQH